MQAYTWQTVPIERLDDSILRQMIVGEHAMLVRWQFKKGALAARHNHPHQQIVVMVSGRLRLAVGDEEAILEENDMVVIPPDAFHEAEAIEDTVVIDIFSPPRGDFLSGGTPTYLSRP